MVSSATIEHRPAASRTRRAPGRQAIFDLTIPMRSLQSAPPRQLALFGPRSPRDRAPPASLSPTIRARSWCTTTTAELSRDLGLGRPKAVDRQQLDNFLSPASTMY